MQEFLQNKLNRWIKKEVFNTQLELGGFGKDTVWLDFNPKEEVEDGFDEDVNNLNVSPSDGLNINNIRNADGRLGEVNP